MKKSRYGSHVDPLSMHGVTMFQDEMDEEGYNTDTANSHGAMLGDEGQSKEAMEGSPSNFPTNEHGLNSSDTLKKLAGEQLSKKESQFQQIAESPQAACALCRFYIRKPGVGVAGACEVTSGGIPWHGHCSFWISAAEEATAAFDTIDQTAVKEAPIEDKPTKQEDTSADFDMNSLLGKRRATQFQTATLPTPLVSGGGGSFGFCGFDPISQYTSILQQHAANMGGPCPTYVQPFVDGAAEKFSSPLSQAAAIINANPSATDPICGGIQSILTQFNAMLAEMGNIFKSKGKCPDPQEANVRLTDVTSQVFTKLNTLLAQYATAGQMSAKTLPGQSLQGCWMRFDTIMRNVLYWVLHGEKKYGVTYDWLYRVYRSVTPLEGNPSEKQMSQFTVQVKQALDQMRSMGSDELRKSVSNIATSCS